MPTIATVDGVKIQFYFDEHPPQHFHAVFAESVAQIRIDPTQVLRGSLPRAKLATVLGWSSKNRAGLMSAGAAAADGQKPKGLQ